MKPSTIRALDTLQKRLQAESYTVTTKLRSHPELLILVITLKEGDVEQIGKQCPEFMRIEGG